MTCMVMYIFIQNDLKTIPLVTKFISAIKSIKYNKETHRK